MKTKIFRSTAAATIAVAGLALCHSAHASTRSTAGTPWEALQAQLDEGGVVTLTNDVTAADGDAMLTVTNAVTLDLNGHTIAFNGSKEVFHIGTGGDLTLTNGLAAGAVTGGGDHGVYIGSNAVFRLQGGAIAGNVSSYGGGGVFVNAFGTFEMSGGSITNNAVYDGDEAGGGVFVVEDGTFTMTGGTISGNAALWAGGVDVRGTFMMSGGEISSNTARAGGGVRVDGSGAFTISGGEISSNTATNYGGGVLVNMSKSFTVSGRAFVSGNARPDGSADNVYVYLATITVSNLTADASIGVTTGTEPTASEPVTFATGATAADAARFTSDNPAFAVDAVNGELRLIKRTTAWDRLQAQLDAGGIVTLTNDVTATPVDWTLTVTNAVTLDLNGHVIDAAGYFGVIQIFTGGNLTLTNGTESAGTITGGYTDLGGGVEVYGAFTMSGGEISGNTASVGGGVGVGWGGTFTMSGGAILDNSANWAGGVEAYGTFTMSGGTISGNVADNDGGGVYVDGAFTVSGSPVVHGNTNSVGTANNVYLPNGCSIAVDGLSADASISVTTEDAPAESSPVTFATGASNGDAAYFFSDDPGCHVEQEDSYLLLVQGAVFKDPQGAVIEDYGVVDWLSNNGFTQADINALGHDSAATDRLYECWLLNLNFKVQDAGATLCFTDITVSNRVSMTVQLVRKAPLAGWINGTLLIYGANDLAAGFGRDPIPDESVEYFTGDPSFNLVTASNDTVTQTAVATMNSSVTAKFFKAEIGIFIPYEPEEPWEPEPEPEPDPEE